MGSFSLMHWIVVLLILLGYLPIIKIVRKAGFSGWWVLLSLIPLVNIVALWWFAYAKWPALDQRRQVG